jgi:hypothetical protein
MGILLISEGITALNAAEQRALRGSPGLIWLYRMGLEDSLLRLLTDCVREYEFGDRATRFFAGQSHGRDSASGALTILRNGVTYENFRLHCQNRLSELGGQMELLSDGYDPRHAPVQETRYRTEYAYLKEYLGKSPDRADRLTNALRTHVLNKFKAGGEAERPPAPADVPEYKRLEYADLYKAFRRLDCENDPDRARIDENNRVLRESLSEHWITLRPILMEGKEGELSVLEDADVPSMEPSAADHRAVSDAVYGVCLDMNRRLAEMHERRRRTVEDIRAHMRRGLDIALTEGEDWVCGRAGVDSVRAWLSPLREELPALLAEMDKGWQEDTERYRSLLTAYTAERDALFGRDIVPGLGGFAERWQAVTEGRLPDEVWQTWADLLSRSPETAGFGEFLEAIRRISRGTGALYGRIRARAAETRMARELANRADLRITALRGAAYEDPDWGEEIIGLMDAPARAEFLAVVQGWQETRARLERRQEAYDTYAAMYTAFEPGT